MRTGPPDGSRIAYQEVNTVVIVTPDDADIQTIDRGGKQL